MATIDLGKIKLVNRGAYNNSTASFTLNTLPADIPVLSNWATPTDSEAGTLGDNTEPSFNILIVSPFAGAEASNVEQPLIG